MAAAEIERIKSRRAWVTHQARSNMNNGVGYASELSQLERVALGTDGIDDDLLSELKSAFFRRRDHLGPSVWPDPVHALHQGVALVSEAFETSLDGLALGTPADLTIFAYDPPTPLTEASLGAHLLFGMSSRDVRDVFVAGRQVLADGKVTGIDEAAVRADARQQASALFGRMS
jgi:cytosine/adenosine deaminase-related metal-dependent hydrolase